MNRAIEGDTVVVRVLPQAEWKRAARRGERLGDQAGGDVGEMWGRCWGDVGEKWGRCGGEVWEVCGGVGGGGQYCSRQLLSLALRNERRGHGQARVLVPLETSDDEVAADCRMALSTSRVSPPSPPCHRELLQLCNLLAGQARRLGQPSTDEDALDGLDHLAEVRVDHRGGIHVQDVLRVGTAAEEEGVPLAHGSHI